MCRMKKEVLWLSLIVCVFLLAAKSYAEVQFTEIFSQEITDEKTITLDSQDFYILAISKTKAKVEFPNGRTYLVTPPECVTEGRYQICLNSIAEDEDKFNISEQRYPLLIQVKIYKQEAKLEIERNFPNTEILAGELVTVEVTLSNKGTENVFSGRYEEEYPAAIEIISCVQCSKNGNKIIWEGNLNFGGAAKFSYVIRAKQETKADIKSILRFGSQNVTDTEKITVLASPLALAESFPESIELGEEKEIDIRLINNNTKYDLDSIELKIFLPAEIEKTAKTGRLEYFTGAWKYKGTLKIGETENLTLQIRSSTIGNYTIKQELAYSYAESAVSREDSFPVQVSTREPVIDVKSIREQDGKVFIDIDLANPNRLQAFSGLQITSSSAAEGVFFDTIKPTETKSASIVLPIAVQGKAENISYTYKTKYGQIRKKIAEVPIPLLQSPQPIAENKSDVVQNNSVEVQENDTIAPEDVIEDDFVQRPIGLAILLSVLLLVLIIVIVLVSRKRSGKGIERKI